MKFLEIFFKPTDTTYILKSYQDAFDEFKKEYMEALEYYCPECKRGFDKRIGKKTHDRWLHTDSPPRTFSNKQD